MLVRPCLRSVTLSPSPSSNGSPLSVSTIGWPSPGRERGRVWQAPPSGSNSTKPAGVDPGGPPPGRRRAERHAAGPVPPDWREAIRKGQAQGCGPGRVAIRKGQANKQVSWTEVGHPGPADVPACGDTDHLVPVRPPGVRGWPSQSGSWASGSRWSKQSTVWVACDEWFGLGSRLVGWPGHLVGTERQTGAAIGKPQSHHAAAPCGWGKRTRWKPGGTVRVGQASPALACGRRRRHNKEGGLGRVWRLAFAGCALHRGESISPGEMGFAGSRWGASGWVFVPGN